VLMSRDSSVSIATGYGLDRDSIPGGDWEFFSSTPALGPTQPPMQWVPGVNRPGREVNHSPPSSAEVKE
jgi:hypothetical protein